MSCRIRCNQDDDSMELIIDGKFVASWQGFFISVKAQGKLEKMLDQAVEYGEGKKVKEIQTVLRII